MPRLLDSVLSSREFAPPELAALVLDGEAYRVGECVAPLDEVPGPLIRAKALVAELPARLIAEQHTAAWVWGAQERPPVRHEVCVDLAARVRPAPDTGLSVREVVILHDDTAAVAGLLITTPMRTAIDLTRFVTDWSDDETGTVRELLRLGNIGVLDCARAMNRRRNLPNKRIALDRLALCG